MTESPIYVSKENFAAWWRSNGFSFEPWVVTKSRALYKRTPEILDAIGDLVQAGFLKFESVANFGSDVEMGYREVEYWDEELRCSAQIVLHATHIEMDFSINRPWDILAALRRFFGGEVVRRQWTNPVEVRTLLKERGIEV